MGRRQPYPRLKNPATTLYGQAAAADGSMAGLRPAAARRVFKLGFHDARDSPRDRGKPLRAANAFRRRAETGQFRGLPEPQAQQVYRSGAWRAHWYFTDHPDELRGPDHATDPGSPPARE